MTGRDRPLDLGAGRWAVPDNRVDLLDGLTPLPAAVTVVVPYYRQQRQLDLVLAALAAQTHPASGLQVVIADDGSPTPPQVSAAAPTEVIVVRQEDVGFRAAAARNLGAAAADGDVLCFLDADTVPEPDYVRRAARLPALCPDALVVGRRRHADLTCWDPARLGAWWAGGPGPVELPEPGWLADGLAGGLREVDDRSYRFVISAVLSMPAALFGELGGFDEGFTAYGGEDWDLAHRAFTAGAVLAHEREAVAWHDGPDQAGRGIDPAVKNAETRALAARIPDPHLRGGGWWPPYPEIVVEVAGGDDPDALLLCARSALAAGDVGVWLPAEVGPADPRVTVGPVPAEVAARARAWVRLERPVCFGPGQLAALAQRVAAPGPGRLTGAGLTVTASRAQSRAVRHGQPLDALFAVEALSDASAPAALAGSPDLADALDRLASWRRP